MKTETICYHQHLIEIVRRPDEGLTTLACAQTHRERLGSIRIEGRIIESNGGYYVVADVLGVSGDVIRSIRPVTSKEAIEESMSGRINAYLWARHNDFRARQEAELAELRAWVDAHREKIKEIPHPRYEQWRRGKTLIDTLEYEDRTYGLTVRLATYRDVKQIYGVYFPERIPMR